MTAKMDTVLDVGKTANQEQVDREGLPRLKVEVIWIVEEGLIEGTVIDMTTAGTVAGQTPAIGTTTMGTLELTDVERAAIRRLREEDTSEVTRRPPMCLTRRQVSSSCKGMIGWTDRRAKGLGMVKLVWRGSLSDQEKRIVRSIRTTLGLSITGKD